MSVSRRALLTLAGLLLAIGRPVAGQSLDLGGRAFGDYFYVASAPDSPPGTLAYPVSVPDTAREGLHGFAYRRLYLTLDFRLSDRLNGRARLEANDSTTGPKGPEPFVKDLWIEWTYSGDHSATVGVTRPPALEVSGAVWGYRSLEKTILDRRGIVGSRDFGLRLDGPLLADGAVRYAFMYANNSAARPEFDQNKRVYGRLSATPTERVTLAAGGDYATYSDRRDRSLRLSAFAGYETERLRVGLEGYRSATHLADAREVEELGASAFGIVQVASEWRMVGRFDWTTQDREEGADPTETFLLAGVAYQPHPNVEVIPNVWARTSTRFSGTDALARLTLDLSF
jgi:hypothetical protein